MTINTGVIESYAAIGEDGEGLTAQVFYEPVLTDGQVITTSQPIRDVEGAAMRLSNTSDGTGRVRASGSVGTLATMLEIEGTDDVLVPPGAMSWTAAEVATGLGWLMRADVSELSVGNA